MSLTTMYPAKNNSPRTYLAAAISADDTSLTLNDASVLPAAPNLLALGTGDDAEVISYTAITGNVVSGLVRGINGTTPGAWAINTICARNFTAADHEAFRENILDLDNRKIEGVAWGDVTGTLADQTDLQDAIDAKQDELTFDTAPTADSTNPVTSEGIKTAIDKEILYFSAQAVSAQASSGQIMRIPSSGTDSKITTNTIVLECTFAAPQNITSSISWTSYAGYISFTGTSSAATTANATLGQKGN